MHRQVPAAAQGTQPQQILPATAVEMTEWLKTKPPEEMTDLLRAAGVDMCFQYRRFERVPRDGNCMFASVTSAAGYPASATALLRAMCVAFYRLHPTKVFNNYLELQAMTERSSYDVALRDLCWTTEPGQEMLFILAHILQRPIQICQLPGASSVTISPDLPEFPETYDRPERVALVLCDRHYDAMVPTYELCKLVPLFGRRIIQDFNSTSLENDKKLGDYHLHTEVAGANSLTVRSVCHRYVWLTWINCLHSDVLRAIISRLQEHTYSLDCFFRCRTCGAC